MQTKGMAEAKAVCGICLIDEESRECSICLEHMCAGAPKWRSICYICVMKPETSNLILDPVTRQPLAKCLCGKIWNQDCSFMAICKNKEDFGVHGLIK